MKVITGPNTKPGPERYPVVAWGRALDPFHKDAFPADLQSQIPDTGRRQDGWMGYDWVGNAVEFIPDGTEIEVEEVE